MASDFLNLLGTLSQTFRVGLNGPMFFAVGDERIHVVNIDGSEYRNFAGSNPVDAQDFVTKAYSDSIFFLMVLKTRVIATTEGLQGGGDLSVDRIFRLDIDGLTEDATPDMANDFFASYDASAFLHKKVRISSIDHDLLDNYVANEHIDHSAVSINTTEGVQGGGDITVTRNLKLDINGLVAEPAPVAGDFVVIYDVSATLHRKVLVSNLLSSGATDTINFGAGSVSATTTDRFLYPEYDSSLAPTGEMQIIVVRPGTIRNMHVLHNSAGGNANAIVYTARKNGANTLLTVSLAANGVSASNVVNSFAVVTGDTISVLVTKAASVGSSPGDVFVSMEYAT